MTCPNVIDVLPKIIFSENTPLHSWKHFWLCIRRKTVYNNLASSTFKNSLSLRLCLRPDNCRSLGDANICITYTKLFKLQPEKLNLNISVMHAKHQHIFAIIILKYLFKNCINWGLAVCAGLCFNKALLYWYTEMVLKLSE